MISMRVQLRLLLVTRHILIPLMVLFDVHTQITKCRFVSGPTTAANAGETTVNNGFACSESRRLIFIPIFVGLLYFPRR